MKQPSRGFLTAAAVSLALHFTGWWLWPAAVTEVHLSAPSGGALNVRAIHNTIAVGPTVSRATAERPPAALVHAADPVPLVPRPPATITTGPDRPAVQQPEHDADEAYLPRGKLTEAPSALVTVMLTYPDEVPPGVYRARLTVFIDETGRVRRVRKEEGSLPYLLEQQARQAFLDASFSPGRVHGQPVKARIDIEVEFAAEYAATGRHSL